MISRIDIEHAAQRIGGYVRQTPIMQLERQAWEIDAQVILKLEQFQHTGSFKARGAFNRMLAQSIPASGIIAASGGNHGAAVAYAAQQLGYHAEIFVPESCPIVKVERLRSYGAQVRMVGANYAEALIASEARAAQSGALTIHAYNQPEVVTGQGTLGREIARQVSELDTLLVAVGGGGLIGGIAAWFGNEVRVIGVEPERAPTLHTALEVGAPTDVEVGGIAADALGAHRVGTLTFEIATHYVEKVLLVTDDAIRDAQRRLWENLRMIVEPGGATALAALLSGQYQPQHDERVGVILCGANTSLAQIESGYQTHI
ncbi:serine/threonine dehydratase [Ktedonobacteria bacterium brp13]|nr:serine/threonine dehydratase [Ktedonobacteria bacterium brp13]